MTGVTQNQWRAIVWISLTCVVTRVESRAHSRLHTGDNDVIKTAVHIPVVAPDFLEAYYYGIYEEESSSMDSMYHGRHGTATRTSDCDVISDVPEELRSPLHMRPDGIVPYYSKYTQAYGIPVIASGSVSDRALTRACYVLRFLLADRADVRNAYYKAYGRVAIIPEGQPISKIPEYTFISHQFDVATRGLGATRFARVSSAGEENIRCINGDRYGNEDILLREIALGIFHLAIKTRVDPALSAKLHGIYEHAMESGWWSNTYSEHSASAYLGEGVQSFFNANAYANPADGRHNNINTRSKLREYNYALYDVIKSIFPCSNNYLKRCNTRMNEVHQQLRMDCPSQAWRPMNRRRYS